MIFDSNAAELHMGILHKRAERFLGRKNSLLMQLDRIGKNTAGVLIDGNDEELQVYEEERQVLRDKYLSLEAEHNAIQTQLTDYENNVLLITTLNMTAILLEEIAALDLELAKGDPALKPVYIKMKEEKLRKIKEIEQEAKPKAEPKPKSKAKVEMGDLPTKEPVELEEPTTNA